VESGEWSEERRLVSKGATVSDYRGLRVYQSAFESAMAIFRLSKHFPAEERYGLTDQLRRSSRAICANIAEAWRKRRYPASFASKLSDADAEAAESQVWLAFAHACGCLAADQQAELTGRYDHICKQLHLMMRDAERWAPTPPSASRSRARRPDTPHSTLPRSTE
jgi:four helix bundle protein